MHLLGEQEEHYNSIFCEILLISTCDYPYTQSVYTLSLIHVAYNMGIISMTEYDELLNYYIISCEHYAQQGEKNEII